MGLTVQLEDKSGKVLERVEDPHNILHRILPRHGADGYHCLAYIDWNANTTFNSMQAARFLEEWDRLEPTVRSPEVRQLLKAVQTLAAKCRDSRQLYLKFYGD